MQTRSITFARTYASTALAFKDASYASAVTHYKRGGWMVRICRFFCGDAR